VPKLSRAHLVRLTQVKERDATRARSSRVQKTKPVEPPIVGNIVHPTSLSVRAMETREEIFDD
jgi:hypothetical protein